MDYEKAYKASLKTAAQWIKDGCTDKEKICLECVFPELRESEDERIRKWLLECVENLSDGNFIEVSRQDVLFYLEKQKDSKVCEEKSKNFTIQKEQKKDNPFEDFLRGYDAGYLHGVDDRVNKKVKPPVEWLKRKKEQKLDTIDADDIQLLGFIYDLLNEIEWKDNWAMSKDECLRRLNNYRPQKPAEWSEEDEKLRRNLMSLLANMRGDRITEETYQKYYPWLKSLRPSWKPSEEQMKAFKGYIEDFQAKAEAAVGGWNNFDVMIRLYEQLQELI